MDDSSLLRYSRQILLQEIDLPGQIQLQSKTALIVGLGGLGSPAAMYLAAAGIGRLILSDDDWVDLSNLQRQIVHGTQDLGRHKVDSARDRLHDLNPEVSLTPVHGRLEDESLQQILESVDVVLDCTDNLESRYAINRACVRKIRPLVSGAVIRFEGQISVFDPARPESPCYNCLYQDFEGLPLEGCSRNGVISPLPGVIGSMQALEAIKLLIHPENALTGHLMIYDAWASEWRKIQLPKNPNCSVCGPSESH